MQVLFANFFTVNYFLIYSYSKGMINSVTLFLVNKAIHKLLLQRNQDKR